MKSEPKKNRVESRASNKLKTCIPTNHPKSRKESCDFSFLAPGLTFEEEMGAMGRGGGKRGLLSKLAFGLLVICFFMAGSNIILISSIEKKSLDSLKSSKQNDNEQPTKPMPKNADAGANHHDLSNVIEKQREKATETVNKLPSLNENSPHNTKSRTSAIYKCSYGATNENRTNVLVPNNEPAFIIIGVQKSGSTSLLSHFRDHPQVLQTKRGLRREAHFFDTAWEHQVEGGWKKHGLQGANDKHCFALQEYMKLFHTETILAHSQTMDHDDSSNSTHHLPLYTFEKTPKYFIDNKIPARIKQTVPWSKLILILRNPVDRAYSQYKMSVKTNHNIKKYSLEDFIFHEFKMMKDFKMTTTPLMVPVDIKEGNNETDPSIPTLADHYEFPIVPKDHAEMDPKQWKRKFKAIRMYPDKGPLGHEILLRRGLYNIQLKWWLEQYTINQDLLVIDYADLAENIQAVFEKVAHFSGIPIPYAPGQDPAEVGIHFDEKVRADSRKDDLPMKETTRRFLTEFYAPYNAQLEELLGPEWSVPKLGWNDVIAANQSDRKQ